MKQTIILLLCSLSALTSCNKEKPYTILSKEYIDKDCICRYYYSIPGKFDWASFQDSCNKYDILDTIK